MGGCQRARHPPMSCTTSSFASTRSGNCRSLVVAALGSSFSLRLRCPRRSFDVISIRFNELCDVLAVTTGVGPGILDRATEPNVVADEILALRFSS